MKSTLFSALLLVALFITYRGKTNSDPQLLLSNKAELDTAKGNLVIVTLDGFRWQELFRGADRELISDPTCTLDTSMTRLLYWATTEEERRRRLMPFVWGIIGNKGQLHGHRRLGSKMNTANMYSFSYPGYNEIFTGNTDLFVSSNKKKNNKNYNVLEYLHAKEAFRGKVVAFTSWEVFPYILNEERNGMLVNSGHESLEEGQPGATTILLNELQDRAKHKKGMARQDELTFMLAREYLEQHRPRVLYLGFGGTDEYAHAGRYDLYLEQANKIDRMLAELWRWIQATDGYKDNTHLIITTDHGRGNRSRNWSSHSAFISGSSQTWMAMMGPAIAPLGEIKADQQIYQEELAGLFAGLLGERFQPGTRR